MERPGLSEAMADRIATFAREDRVSVKSLPAAAAFFAGCLHSWLLQAESDAQAERLFSMLADVRTRGFDSDILRAFSGRAAFTLVAEGSST